MPRVIVKLVGILVVMSAAIAGVLWVSLELVGAVSKTADSMWYVVLGLAIAAVVFVVLLTVRSRTREMIVLTATTAVLLVAVLLTYPTDSVPCTPGAGQSTTADTAPAGLGDGIVVDDADLETGSQSGSGDCK